MWIDVPEVPWLNPRDADGEGTRRHVVAAGVSGLGWGKCAHHHRASFFFTILL
jgi:hypothetical protein